MLPELRAFAGEMDTRRGTGVLGRRALEGRLDELEWMQEETSRERTGGLGGEALALLFGSAPQSRMPQPKKNRLEKQKMKTQETPGPTCDFSSQIHSLQEEQDCKS